MHPFQFTLDLLKQAIDKAPRFFPRARREEMLATLAAMRAEPATPREKIEEAVVSFGKEIWPYRESFWRIHDVEGREREERLIRERLAPEMRGRFETFLARGGRVQDVRRGGEFEQYFTPEEKLAIAEAKLEAHERVVKEVEELCVGPEKAACELHVADFRREQEEIERLISALGALAGRSEKWAPEILDKVRAFEMGWSGVEREVSKEDVRGEIDYYEGVIAVT